MKNQQTAEAPTAKLTPEQEQILDIVNKSRYNAAQLDALMYECRLANCKDFSNSLLDCVELILSQSEMLDTEDVLSVYVLFSFARLLSSQESLS